MAPRSWLLEADNACMLDDKGGPWQLLVLCCYSYAMHSTGIVTINIEHPWVARVLECWGVSATVSGKDK